MATCLARGVHIIYKNELQQAMLRLSVALLTSPTQLLRGSLNKLGSMTTAVLCAAGVGEPRGRAAADAASLAATSQRLCRRR